MLNRKEKGHPSIGVALPALRNDYAPKTLEESSYRCPVALFSQEKQDCAEELVNSLICPLHWFDGDDDFQALLDTSEPAHLDVLLNWMTLCGAKLDYGAGQLPLIAKAVTPFLSGQQASNMTPGVR